MLKVASVSKIAPDFSIRKLCMLERADINGRISASNSDHLEKIELCKMLSEDLGCIDKHYQFKDAYTERAFYKGKTDYHENQLFNDTWGEIIMLSGLPGTGKDTFIKAHYENYPVITLDDIRKELKILPTDNQGLVVATANERAKELLRKKQPFVWNATNITTDIRKLLIPLFEDYGASVKIVFLETEWNEGIRRNSSRQAEVPKHAIEKMLSRLEPPEPYEAQNVEYHTT
jgi:predicted kinase